MFKDRKIEPVFFNALQITEDLYDALEQMEGSDFIESELLSDMLSKANAVYQRIDSDNAPIIKTINGVQSRVYVWADNNDQRPENMMIILGQIDVKRNGFAKDFIITPYQTIMGADFKGMLVYQMSCCNVQSTLALIATDDGLIEINRDPKMGVDDDQRRILEDKTIIAGAVELEFLSKLAKEILVDSVAVSCQKDKKDAGNMAPPAP